MKSAFLLIISVTILALHIGCSGDSARRWGWSWTYALEFGRQPRWSPDGSKILFGDDRIGQPALYIWQPGNDPQPLSESLPSHNWDYQWSPSGFMIAFTAPGAPGDSSSGTWIVDAETGVYERILDSGRDVSWHFSGESVLVRLDNPPDGSPGIYQVNLRTRETVWLNIDGFKPACSPTEDRLAFSTDEIRALLAMADNNIVFDQFGCAGLTQFGWSDDGRYLGAVFNDYTSGTENGVLWRLSVIDGTIRGDSLTSWTAYPSVSPDGSEIAFVRTSEANWRGLWLYMSNGEEIRLASFGSNPDFSPDGNSIAANSTEGGIRILSRMY